MGEGKESCRDTLAAYEEVTQNIGRLVMSRWRSLDFFWLLQSLNFRFSLSRLLHHAHTWPSKVCQITANLFHLVMQRYFCFHSIKHCNLSSHSGRSADSPEISCANSRHPPGITVESTLYLGPRHSCSRGSMSGEVLWSPLGWCYFLNQSNQRFL